MTTYEVKPLTPQQAAILRQSKPSQRARKRFPVGTRVAMRPGAAVQGTVIRHVPGTDAQGGYFVVQWDHGPIGRHTASALYKVEES